MAARDCVLTDAGLLSLASNGGHCQQVSAWVDSGQQTNDVSRTCFCERALLDVCVRAHLVQRRREAVDRGHCRNPSCAKAIVSIVRVDVGDGPRRPVLAPLCSAARRRRRGLGFGIRYNIATSTHNSLHGEQTTNRERGLSACREIGSSCWGRAIGR